MESIYVEYGIGLCSNFVSMLHEKFRLQTGFMMYLQCRSVCEGVCVGWGVYWPLEPRSPDSHCLPRQETFSNKQLREALNLLTEARQQASPFVLKASVSPWVLARGHTFHHGQQTRQIYRLSKKGNESILMSGLSLPAESCVGLWTWQFQVPSQRLLRRQSCWRQISGLLKELGEQSWKHGWKAILLGQQVFSLIEIQLTLCLRALNLKWNAIRKVG